MTSSKRKTAKATPKKKPAAGTLQGVPVWWTHTRLHLLLVFAFAVLLYANTLGHEYAQDDAIVITENVYTQQGLQGIPGILSYDTFYGFFQEPGKAKLVAGGRYRPLSLVTFALEYSIFGQNPFISHLINALFYGLCAVLMYLLLLELASPKRQPARAFFLALAGSLLFAAHPVHTEAVANIKGRDEIMAFLGSLAALILALRAVNRSRAGLHFWGALCLFLGLLSKENAITFLAVIPLALYYFTAASPARIARALLPYAGAAFLFLLIRGQILGWSLGAPSGELMNNPFLKLAGSAYVPFSASEKLATITYTLGKYLQLLFVPHPLTHDYYPRHIGILTWGNPLVLLSLAAYLGLLFLAVRGFFKKDLISFGVWFYLLTLSIVSNFVFPIGTNMAERLLFLPSAGFCLAFPALVLLLTQRKALRLTRFAQLYPAIGIVTLFLLFFSVKTLTRNPVWHDNYTLFTTDIRTSPNSAKLRNAVGGELIARSADLPDEDPRKTAMLEEATGHLLQAIGIHPTYKNAYLLLGNAYNYLRRYDASIEAYQRAIALDPAYTDARNNLGITYRDAGRYYGEQQGDLNRALAYLEKAYELRPDEYEVLRLLGVANGIRGDVTAAVNWFSKAAAAAPDNADAWFNLGTAYYNAGDPVTGKTYHDKAIAMDPSVTQRMR